MKEAKDTVKLKACVKTYCINSCDLCELSECYLDKMAEISFKAGQEESDKKWRQILRDTVVMAKLTGIRKVVEWLKEDLVVTHNGFGVTISMPYIRWQAKLKEWGIKNELT